MKLQGRPLFEPIEPPPGGLARLRAGLSDRQRVRGPRFALAGAVGVLASMLIIFVASETHARDAQPVDLIGALQVLQREPVALGAGQLAAVERLPSGNPQVLFYRLAIADRSAERAPQ